MEITRGSRGKSDAGCGSLSRPPGLTILSRSSPLSWSMALHVLLLGRGADGRAARPGKSRGGAAGRPRPFPLAFQKAEKKKKNGSQSRAWGKRAGAGSPEAPRWAGGGGEGDWSRMGRRGLRSGKGGMEVWALRLTKPAEGAALCLPVLRAPPRELRSPAAPSGSPAPPPLREATWTCRFGPSAKSQLQGCGSPPPRPGSPAPLRPKIGGSQGAGRPWSMLQSLEAMARARGWVAGARGARSLELLGRASGRDWDCEAGGRAPGKVPARRRALREHEPGGGASESESDKPPPLRKVLRGRRGPRGLPLSCRQSPWHWRWKVFKATKASQPRLPREVTGPAAQLTSSSRGPEEGKDPQGWSLN